MQQLRGIIVSCSLVLVFSGLANAQSCVPCGDNLIGPAQGQARKIADGISYATVGTEIGLDTWHSWRSNDRKSAFEKQLLRTGVTIGVSELTKLAVRRTRPDLSDTKSFFSEHTALAFSSLSGNRLSITIPLSGATAMGRLKADKHYLTDVLTGMFVGLLTNKIR